MNREPCPDGGRYTCGMQEHLTDIARDCSPFLDSLVQREPAWWQTLQSSGRLLDDSPPLAEDLATHLKSGKLDRGLRRFRNHEMMRIIWRDLNRLAGLDETLGDLSILAELCLRAAVEEHFKRLQERFGTPRNADGGAQELIVLAMGKLGGRELNLSSDIDLVFCFPEAGQCDGRKSIANETFFTRLVRAVIRSLSEVTEDGFCFRVDARLRPFGSSGPLVCSFGAMEQYYQREGRDWERYALVKARPVTGDPAHGKALLNILRPFVYRRYIDFGAVEALQEMRETIRRDASSHHRQRDIKRGAGGIREIEFMVQAHQLLRGGTEPALQTPSLMHAIDALVGLELIDLEVANTLQDAYVFLRQLENAIQALHDQQTHELPDGEDLRRVAIAMRCDDTTALAQQVSAVRNSIGVLFAQYLGRQDENTLPCDDAWSRQWQALWAGSQEPKTDEDSPISQFSRRLGRQSLSQRARQRLDRFMPQLLKHLDERNISGASLTAVLDLVFAICRRSAYLALLVQNPRATERMLDLFEKSDWVAETVTRHPALLDELIDPTLGQLLPTQEEMEQSGSRIFRAQDDLETLLPALNHMKLATSLRVAVAELETKLSPGEVAATLTDLAEVLLGACLRLAQLETGSLEASQENRGAPTGLGIIGYGSLGARELSFNSDLDLIFLYDLAAHENDENHHEKAFTKMARRLISLMTVPTVSGKLYETDTRLRPNGRAGLLVSSTFAFEKYQKEKAWTWELQALTRARFLCGDEQVGRQFDAIRKEVLCTRRDVSTLRGEVTSMRQRLRRQFSGSDPLKHGPGGLVDIGFLAQLGVLETAADAPDVIVVTGTPQQLARLVEARWLSETASAELIATHERLSRARHLAVICRESQLVGDDRAQSERVCRALLGAHAQAWFSTGSDTRHDAVHPPEGNDSG